MRTVIAVVTASLVSAFLTYLWVSDQQGPPQGPAPSSDEEVSDDGPAPPASTTREEAGQPAPELAGRSTPPPPKVKLSSGGMTVTGARNQMETLRALQQAFADELHAKDRRIRELEAKVGRLETTLPKPEVLEQLESASIEDLENLLREMRSITTKRLLTPPEHLRSRYAEFLSGEGTGTARLLPRGKYDKLVELRGGGAYWSFKTQSNSYDKEPDLELQSGFYHTSFYGGTQGFLMDLGEYPIDDVDADSNRPPAGMAAPAVAKWEWMFQPTEPESERRPDRRVLPGKNPGLTDRVKSVPNHTYLLRAILPREHDILVVFRAVEEDDRGQSIIYRVLREFEIPMGRRR